MLFDMFRAATWRIWSIWTWEANSFYVGSLYCSFFDRRLWNCDKYQTPVRQIQSN